MQRALTSLLLAVLVCAVPLPAFAGKKFKNTHLAVPSQRMVNLAATIDASDSSALTLDGLGTPLVMQQHALVVTDVIVTPVVVTPDTTTPIWIVLTLGGRGFEIRRLGAQTQHISFGGGIAATPNQPLGAANHSTVQVEVNVMGYLVDGQSLASGVSPEQ